VETPAGRPQAGLETACSVRELIEMMVRSDEADVRDALAGRAPNT